METKVFTAGDFVLLYVLFITSFDSDHGLAGGTLLCMLQGYVPPKRMRCPMKFSSATGMNRHDFKLGLVRKLREQMNTFPFNSK